MPSVAHCVIRPGTWPAWGRPPIDAVDDERCEMKGGGRLLSDVFLIAPRRAPTESQRETVLTSAPARGSCVATATLFCSQTTRPENPAENDEKCEICLAYLRGDRWMFRGSIVLWSVSTNKDESKTFAPILIAQTSAKKKRRKGCGAPCRTFSYLRAMHKPADLNNTRARTPQ